MIDITGLEKGAVLAALYNAARPQGMGFMQYKPKPMSLEEAKKFLDEQEGGYFDYLFGRVMKLDLEGDLSSIEEHLYDRDNGKGCAQIVISELRRTGQVWTPMIEQIHKTGRLDAAADAKIGLTSETSTKTIGRVSTTTIGLGDVADKLGPEIEKALDDKGEQHEEKTEQPKVEEGRTEENV